MTVMIGRSAARTISRNSFQRSLQPTSASPLQAHVWTIVMASRVIRFSLIAAALFASASCMRDTAAQSTSVLPAVAGNQLRAVGDFAVLSDRKEPSRALFLEASRVLLHPRCANCLPSGDVPLQGMQMNGQPLARSIPSMQVVSET